MKSKKEAHCRFQETVNTPGRQCWWYQVIERGLLFLSNHRVGLLRSSLLPTRPCGRHLDAHHAPSLRSCRQSQFSQQTPTALCLRLFSATWPLLRIGWKFLGVKAPKSTPQQVSDGIWVVDTQLPPPGWENQEVCSLRKALLEMSSSCSLGKAFYRLSTFSASKPISSSYFPGSVLK